MNTFFYYHVSNNDLVLIPTIVIGIPDVLEIQFLKWRCGVYIKS